MAQQPAALVTAVAAKSGQRSVRLGVVLAPKSIECQFVRQVKNGRDKGMVEEVFKRSIRHRDARMRVLLCEDGRGDADSSAVSVRMWIQELYDF